MIDSFKNIERLRYRLSNDMRKIASDNNEKSSDIKDQISNTIFATVFSAFITEVVFREPEVVYDWRTIFKLILVFVGIYILSYIAYNFLYSHILAFWKERKIHSVRTGMKVMIQIQKDFDNIACDSVLMARSYRNAFKDLPQDSASKTLRTFYYYEILHYIDVACDKTQDLINYKQYCIRTMDKAVGVDLFRVINIKNMIQELNAFLQQKFNEICYENSQKEAIEYQYNETNKKINFIVKEIEKLEEE